jgi:purine-binding chemotaxis protein CheW
MKAHGNEIEYVTTRVADQHFGLPISRIQDVFAPGRITPVPLAASAVAGVLNLRGRVVTAIDLRQRLNLPGPPGDAPRMAVGVEWNGESYGILVDAVGEVIKVDLLTHEECPVNLDSQLAGVSTGIHRLEEHLLVVLDVDRILDGVTAEAT